MVDNELLQAMRQMIQDEINKALDEKLQPILAEQKIMQETLAKVLLTQENTVLPQLAFVYENQAKAVEDHKAMQKMQHKIEVLQEVLKGLKRANPNPQTMQ